MRTSHSNVKLNSCHETDAFRFIGKILSTLIRNESFLNIENKINIL